MKVLTVTPKKILLIVSLLLFFNTLLSANISQSEKSYQMNTEKSESYSAPLENSNNMEVSLNSFGSMSVIIMLILTSLLGAFFVRDELNGLLE